MPTHAHLLDVARELRKRLGKRAFLTLPREEVTGVLRQVSGEDSTRIKKVMGADLDRALLERGVRCFPGFAETTTGDNIRVFHSGTVMGDFVDMLRHPSEQTDRELAAAITKFKGKWDWGELEKAATSGPSEPAFLSDGSAARRLSKPRSWTPAAARRSRRVRSSGTASED